MLGASICVSSDSHAAVTILNDHLKGRMKGGHKISVDILILACAVLLFIQGIKIGGHDDQAAYTDPAYPDVGYLLLPPCRGLRNHSEWNQ